MNELAKATIVAASTMTHRDGLRGLAAAPRVRLGCRTSRAPRRPKCGVAAADRSGSPRPTDGVRTVCSRGRRQRARAEEYATYDFEPVSIRRGYYQPSNIDALVMRRDT